MSRPLIATVAICIAAVLSALVYSNGPISCAVACRGDFVWTAAPNEYRPPSCTCKEKR